MGSLEELTKEELISWIRENNPGIDEEAVAVKLLGQRRTMFWKNRDDFFAQFWDLNSQIEQLVQKYADGPVKPGVKLRCWPAEAKAAYEKLDRERRSARAAYREWWDKSTQLEWKIIDIQQKQIDRVIAIADAAVENAKRKI